MPHNANPQNDFPLCSNCAWHHNDRSSVFGDCWSCERNAPNYSDVIDNDTNTEVVPCTEFLRGTPTTNHLG